MSPAKKNVLLVGSGGVGTIAALNLETGGFANVTAVLRSNYDVVEREGFTIESCDHGILQNWRPSHITKTIPDLSTHSQTPFDYLVCTTKNVADIPPSLSSLIAPAVTPSHTTIVLIQNGLNIEKPLISAFPKNVILSGISMIGSHEPRHGHIEHDDNDNLIIGAFHNPNLSIEDEKAAAREFVHIYGAGGKTNCTFTDDVGLSRWRKLVYNACLNPVCAITGLDTGRVRLAPGCVEGLIRPAMHEILAAAKAAGFDLPSTLPQTMIDIDPLDMYLPPSMLGDLRKGNFIEFENILGEPLREGEKMGVPMPTMKVLYHLCESLQWKNKDIKGLVEIPPKRRTLAGGEYAVA